MHRVAKIAIAGLFLTVVLVVWWKRPLTPEKVESGERSTPAAVLAAQGRVEGREETISLGSSADGVVKEVLVKDGQRVSKGTLLARIECGDISAEIDLARARVDSAQQARVRLLRGHRDEEREAAAQQTAAAEAVATQAQEHFRRFDALFEKGEISRDAFEQVKRDLDVAHANYERAVDEQKLANAAPLPEEISLADAEISAAERNVIVATNKLEKCNVRAPISGTVLKVMTKIGESYSTLLPHPLLTLADESVRRVRAEVDERDISKVRLGQASVVTADGFPGRNFNGQVIQISPAMKSKSVLTEDPSQKVDRDVLDVIVELERSEQELPLGLRVTVQMTGVTTPVAPASMRLSAAPSQVAVAPRQEAIRTSSPEPATKVAGLLLQVGAMKHRENADALAATLRNKSFPAFVSAREGDPFYRVDVGPYPDAKAARTVADELKDAGFGTAIERSYSTSTR